MNKTVVTCKHMQVVKYNVDHWKNSPPEIKLVLIIPYSDMAS